jgi:UDP-glucose 4-epimerase
MERGACETSPMTQVDANQAAAVLITGGAGYIGATVASACLDAGLTPVILDNLSTGRVEYTTGRAFYEGDIEDGELIDRVFREHPEIGTVVHCGALIVVPDSVAEPLSYYRENVSKTIRLLGHLDRNGCRRFLFSSSASLYAPAPDFSVDEQSALAPTSPYARTKLVVEMILDDIVRAGALEVVSLRYFNPIGADPQLRTGLQTALPSHVLGKLITAHRLGEPFSITGVDWPTRDGSGIRDYIHIWDLARAHVAAIQRFDALIDSMPADHGSMVINLGTGTGTTVREIVETFRDVVGPTFEVREAPAREGDAIGCFTRNDKAVELLGWTPALSIEQGIRDSLAWAEKRPSVLGET